MIRPLSSWASEHRLRSIHDFPILCDMNSKLLGLLVIFFPLQLSADIIFQKAPNLVANFALISKPDAQEMADYFTPSVSANITSVNWFGSFIPGGSGQPHDYSIRFFKD